MRNGIKSTLLLLVSVLVTLVIAEIAAQFYVSQIADKDRMFQTDTLLGWRPIPNLDITRKGPEGEKWRIQTNDSGWRNVPSANPSLLSDTGSTQTILLGDSYVFGQGVEVRDRFDSVWAELDSTLYPRNLGVMGYGTGQQLLSLEQLHSELRPGDRVVLITHFNDIFDLLRKDFSGRPKPWFELNDKEEIVLHKPDIDFSYWLRNNSYLYTRLLMLNEQRRNFPQKDLMHSVTLYSHLLEEHLAPLRKQDIEIILVYHGLQQYNRPEVEKRLENSINKLSVKHDFTPVKLDSVLNMANHYLSDAHWNAAGHHVVGKTLYQLSR